MYYNMEYRLKNRRILHFLIFLLFKASFAKTETISINIIEPIKYIAPLALIKIESNKKNQIWTNKR